MGFNSAFKGLRGLYVYSKTLGNLNAYKTDDTGWDMYLNSVDTHSFSTKCQNMEVCRSENSEQIGRDNDKIGTMLL